MTMTHRKKLLYNVHRYIQSAFLLSAFLSLQETSISSRGAALAFSLSPVSSLHRMPQEQHGRRRLELGQPQSFILHKKHYGLKRTSKEDLVTRFGWLEDFFEPKSASSSTSREIQYPEQYPATYERNTAIVESDKKFPEIELVRPLLKNTQLENRSLQLVFDANRDGWNPSAFHAAVDGKGAAVVLTKTADGETYIGGYNPKGWASLGGARPSVAAFLFYEPTDKSTKPKDSEMRFQKLQKVGGGGLACARDDPGYGISFGPDGLVIALQEGGSDKTTGRERWAQSKLGPYFERGPESRSSLFEGGGSRLAELKVLVGCYEPGEDIPYSGGVLDMTSG